MEAHLEKLAGIKFGQLDPFHKFEVHNLAQEMDSELRLGDNDVLSVLSDWHKCTEDRWMRERIEAVAERIMHANEIGRLRTRARR